MNLEKCTGCLNLQKKGRWDHFTGIDEFPKGGNKGALLKAKAVRTAYQFEIKIDISSLINTLNCLLCYETMKEVGYLRNTEDFFSTGKAAQKTHF